MAAFLETLSLLSLPVQLLSLYFLLLLQKKVAKKSRADFDAEPFFPQPLLGQNRPLGTELFRKLALVCHARRYELFRLNPRCRPGYQMNCRKCLPSTIPGNYLMEYSSASFFARRSKFSYATSRRKM